MYSLQVSAVSRNDCVEAGRSASFHLGRRGNHERNDLCCRNASKSTSPLAIHESLWGHFGRFAFKLSKQQAFLVYIRKWWFLHSTKSKLPEKNISQTFWLFIRKPNIQVLMRLKTNHSLKVYITSTIQLFCSLFLKLILDFSSHLDKLAIVRITPDTNADLFQQLDISELPSFYLVSLKHSGGLLFRNFEDVVVNIDKTVSHGSGSLNYFRNVHLLFWFATVCLTYYFSLPLTHMS